MSEKCGFYRVAIEAAAARGMTVLLYDEGMYCRVVVRAGCRPIVRDRLPLPGAARDRPRCE
jgi:hypothetical protein